MNEDVQRFDLETMPLARLVSYAGTMITQRWARTMTEAGYDSSGIVVLFALPDEVDLSQREIARRIQLSASRVTSIADALEGQGLVERIRDGQDRRVTWLRITEMGRLHRAQAQRLVRERFSDLLPPVEAADEVVIRRYLSTLIGTLGDSEGRG